MIRHFLRSPYQLAHSPAHVPLYSRAIRCVESSTNLYHSLCQRRRVTGSSLYTSGFQSRQCHRRIYRRSTPASRTGISISRPDRSAPRLRRVYPPHAVLQKIRAEEDVILKPQNMQNTVEAVLNLFRDRLRPMLKQIGVRDRHSIAGY